MRVGSCLVALALSVAAVPAAHAALPEVVKIGILNDMSGPFADQSGKGSVAAARMAVEDFAAASGSFKVEILSADHQNKPDVGSQIVREWVDRQGVAAVADAVNSAVALSVNELMRERNRVLIASSTGTSDLTGKACAPTTVQWTLDTWALGNAAARALVKEGGTSWYFISFDYALGAALERDATAALKALGGTVSGSIKHPLGTTDFSSYLISAQSSGAKVVALADTGADLVNGVKQAAEFGVQPNQMITALFAQITDIDAIGLRDAKGLLVSEAFYWDLNDDTRAFGRRFAARFDGRMPTENQAGVYSSVLAYLNAVKAADSVDGDKVMAAMRAAPIQDKLFGTVTVRPDGRAVHAMYEFRVKQPEQSKGRWDYYDLVATIPAEEAFRPIEQGNCPAIQKQ